MPTVWVTQETSHDFSPAEQYGEVRFLTKDDFNNTRNSIANAALWSELKFILKRYDPNEDWIVIAGSPYVAAAVFLLLGLSHHKQIKVLRWDNRDFMYRPMYMEIPA